MDGTALQREDVEFIVYMIIGFALFVLMITTIPASRGKDDRPDRDQDGL